MFRQRGKPQGPACLPSFPPTSLPGGAGEPRSLTAAAAGPRSSTPAAAALPGPARHGRPIGCRSRAAGPPPISAARTRLLEGLETFVTFKRRSGAAAGPVPPGLAQPSPALPAAPRAGRDGPSSAACSVHPHAQPWHASTTLKPFFHRCFMSYGGHKDLHLLRC